MSNLVPIIISNVCVASLIGCLAWFIGRSGRRARIAHGLWVAFFLKLVTPPLITLPIDVPSAWCPAFVQPKVVVERPRMLPAADPAQMEAGTIQTDRTAVPIVNREIAASVEPTRRSRTSHLIFIIWGMGFGWIIVQGSLRFVRLLRLLIHEGRADDAATDVVERLINGFDRSRVFRLQLFSYPRVLRVPVRISPMLFGVAHKTMIVCPDLLWDSFTEEERAAFLAHEAAHYCRRDHWVRWLEWTVSAAYWWFPAVYSARQQMERHEESCCDAWAVEQLRSTPRRYAEALLKAIDFISVEHAGVPRLASGMKQTQGLEERLRLVMKPPTSRPPRRLHWISSFGSLFLLLLHPVVRPYANADVPQRPVLHVIHSETQPDSAASVAAIVDDNPVELPPEPSGFWNANPSARWADFELSLDGASLSATAGEGIQIETPAGRTIDFDRSDMTSIVDIPALGRVVIGSNDGSVRLWDLADGLPVSLLGRHTATVTSLAWHPEAGLVSADSSGAVMRWDVRSGEILNTFSAQTGIQSVRFSSSGHEVAVLTGQWDSVTEAEVKILDSSTLEESRSYVVAHETAVIISADDTWLSVGWSGMLRTLDSRLVLGAIGKSDVSALVFTQGRSMQDTADNNSDAAANTRDQVKQ